MALQSGFPGERISVLPRPRVAALLKEQITSRLVVTDCGFFPRAKNHERVRPKGCLETVFILCVDGKGWAQLPQGSVIVRPGQVLVVPAGLAHSYGAADEDPWTIWWIHVRGVDIPMFLELIGVIESSPIVNIADLSGVVGLFEKILQLMERDESTTTLQAVTGASWHLLSLLAASRNTQTISQIDPVQIGIAFLQRNFVKPVNVSTLADKVGLSVSHFSALFRESAGCGPRLYQTRLRMMKARQLLDTTDIPISKIANMVGYEDPLYFSRRFRSVHGVTATEHRARAKG
jgi:AraC family transcriptional regulator of arabinose operon